jgi:hypothetical protein
MIATMVKNPPEDIKDRRATLIIMPVYVAGGMLLDDPDVANRSLLEQWSDEIEKMTPAFAVRIHHGKGALTVSNIPFLILSPGRSAKAEVGGRVQQV